jgi:hypothetical protein
MMDSPYHPYSDARFTINEKGTDDIEEEGASKKSSGKKVSIPVSCMDCNHRKPQFCPLDTALLFQLLFADSNCMISPAHI